MLNFRVLGLITSGVLLVSGLSGCGFKSDLSLPGSESKNPLFKSDSQPTVETDVQPMLEPLTGQESVEVEIQPAMPLAESTQTTPESEGILVDITAIATDGRILVSPGDDTSEIDASEGVPVNIEDLFPDEEASNTQ